MGENMESYWERIRKKRPGIKLFLVVSFLIIAIGIYYSCISIFFNDQQKGIIDAIIRIAIPAILAYLFVNYTFHKTGEYRFLQSLSDLVQEMINNTKKLTNEAFDYEIGQLKGKIQRKEWVGFGKSPSFTNWNNNYGNFFLKYLPTSNYYFFINQGFFNTEICKKIGDGERERIAKMYDRYSQINAGIQGFENQMRGKNEYLNMDDFREFYYHIRTINFEVSGFKNFLQDSCDTIETINHLFPEIGKDSEIVELKKKINQESDC